MVIDSRHLITHSRIVMQRRKRARKGGSKFTSAITIAERLSPRYGPLSSFEPPNIDAAASVIISSNAEPSDDYI